MADFDFGAHIRALSEISGISGHETETADYFARALAPVCDEVRRDAMGNVLGLIRAAKPDAPTLLIDSHSDEIGFLVAEHKSGGFLTLARVGGMDPGVLPASEILLYGKQTVRGVVAAKPPHLCSEEDRKKKPRLEDLFVDTMLSDEQMRDLLPIGTPAGFAAGVSPLLGGRYASRGLDDRVAGVTLLALASRTEREKLSYNLALLFSVQEEVGGVGAATAAFALAPDLCLCVDVSFADFPGSVGRLLTLGSGVGVSFSDTLSRTLTEDVLRVARDESIEVQVLAEPGETGTNAHEIQVAGHGVPSTILSLPLSYMHSPAEVIDEHDLDSAVRLMEAYAYHGTFCPKEVVLVG